MDAQTLAYYEARADEAGGMYRTATGGISEWFDEAFSDCAKILDVGCGAGRDLCLLFQKGHDAIGVDASAAMLEASAETCRQAGYNSENRLIKDTLPGLTSIADASFDGVLCSAVLMHLPEEQVFDSVYGMRRVLCPGGRLLLSIPQQRPDVDPKTRRDPDGRYFADLRPAKLKLLLERVGFRVLWERSNDDALRRSGYSWNTLLFELLDADAERPLDKVESILNRDKKDATYKLALFRALADIAQTQYNIACYDQPGQVGIPIKALAERWLIYYWPIVASKTFIPQKYGEKSDGAKPVAIRAPLRNVINAFGEGGGLPAFLVALKNGELSQPVYKIYQDAIRKICGTIWKMPVRYAGGGADFSVFGYNRKTQQVTMPETLWRELSLTGSWILDATILRWAELTERLAKGAVTVSMIVEKLLAISDPDRETRDARQLFAKMGVFECVWSGRPIHATRFDVDHVIPFGLWRNNDLWNLLPAHPAVNNSKRDLLPTQGLLRRRRNRVIDYWEALRHENTERFDREAETLCGISRLRSIDWQAVLFTRLTEAVEITAVQRHIPRWEPEGFLARPGLRQRNKVPIVPLANIRAKAKPHDEPEMFTFAEVGPRRAFRDYLPLVGTLAAGKVYSGFDIAGLDEASDCLWLAVPRRLSGRNRFVIRIGGDSMAPELGVGDLVVFEYHRTARAPNQIVIANIAELGITSDLATEHAIKRLVPDNDDWIFRSTNPRYEDIRVAKKSCAYPILGVMAGRL